MFWVLIIAVVLVAWLAMSYNGLVTLVNQADEAWADIDVQLKRRYDLIPNLVNTVKGYAAHESQAFEKVTAARAKAMQAGNATEKNQAENLLTGALKSVFAIAEAYPDLKANQNFLALQQELADTENKIQAARRFYNGNVRDLNIKIVAFPSNLVAQTFKFQPRDFFGLDDTDHAAKEPVAVKF